ncbi:MAG: methyltransferase domain-containing protein [Saprospiraceae bacterium]|nr:methyltransferase domain-containing protein [Saprospiraceae bacterium]
MSKTQHKAVIQYYEQTDWDHRYVWNRGAYQAAHFGIYDEKANHHKAALINTNRIMADLANITPGMHVLDAGCGWGGASLWLAKERKAHVTGVNITPYQVAECKEKAKKMDLQYVCTFIESDYCDTPFADEQFDVVWSCESLCHAAKKEDFYHEAHRILKPGGRLIIADYHRIKRPLSKDEETLLLKWLDGWACMDIDTSEEHHRHASAAGFSSVHQHDYSKNVEVSLHNLYQHAARWSWIGTLGKHLRLIKAVRDKNVKGTKAMYQAYQADLWRYMVSLCSK